MIWRKMSGNCKGKYRDIQKMVKCWFGIDTMMSGSPILQSDKLIGAVTHVFVNDPTCGYAIVMESMLETAENWE